jgi:transposase
MNATPVKVTNEQVNDVPLLVGILEQMGVQRHIDACVEQHGNWEGISIGTLVEIWLCYILTEQDHRMVAVREWAIDRRVMFNTLLGIDLRDTDLSDDRLAVALSKLGYEAFQQQADESMVADWVSVYALPTHTIRLDSTSVSMYSQIEYEGSLLQRGHSKDHRPDLVQFKVMMSTLDPLGMPLRCEVISGEQADDGLYVPSYDQTVRVLGRADVLVVGDSKMAALGTRGHIVAGGSCYLCAYRPTGTNTVLEDWVSEALAHQAEWEQVTEVDETTGEVQSVVVIYAGQRPQEWTEPVTEQTTAWQERVLVVRSESMREKLLQHSQDRLTRLEDDLAALRRPIGRGRKRYQTQAELQAVVDRLLDKYQCQAFMTVGLVEDLLADGSTRWIVGTWVLDNAAWAAYEALLGWQLYLTNTTTAHYENTALLWSYRHQIFHERTFSRLKTRIFVRYTCVTNGASWA